MNANRLADELMKFYNLEENTAPIQIFDLAATMLRQQQVEIEEFKNQLTFITNINRLGLGVQKENGLTSSEIEKVWLSIEEQKDDNFHYGWKKCEQLGIRKVQENETT
jgi:hypothetical protein